MRAAGGRVVDAPDVLVPRVPPSAAHFWSQRVRQAYDDLAQPWRLVPALATVPVCLVAAVTRPQWLLGLALVPVALSLAGWLRAGAWRGVPATVPLWAPAWGLERAVCSWLALAARLRGGVVYAGTRMPVAAHSRRWLARRHGATRSTSRVGARSG
ncbi:hypothetical protein GCM10025868_13210 [Angustibacter aerolatus]|uniref:Uncharacterized protein n=1 Tax=Angustibacter aerolatus TaxID=1162965 RepID=A0ABQ6JEQ8_9ACTN|nr:hypothetical protein GCM10025868_13210 [Angustibacter aerolatus]